MRVVRHDRWRGRLRKQIDFDLRRGHGNFGGNGQGGGRSRLRGNDRLLDSLFGFQRREFLDRCVGLRNGCSRCQIGRDVRGLSSLAGGFGGLFGIAGVGGVGGVGGLFGRRLAGLL